MQEQATSNVEVKPADPSKVRKLWTIAGVVGIITIAEIVLALVWSYPRDIVFIAAILALMIAKAFYIVSEFMHLKGEVKTLVWSILIPLLFVVWLVIALMFEGNATGEARGVLP